MISGNNVTPCVVRQAQQGDLESIRALHHELCRFERDQGHDRQLDPDWAFSAQGEEYFVKRITGGDGVALVAVAEGTAVGYLLGRVDLADSGPVGRIESVYVEPTYRRRGLGTQLMVGFLQWAGVKQLRRLTVAVAPANAGAIGLYRKMGFRDATLVLEKPG